MSSERVTKRRKLDIQEDDPPISGGVSRSTTESATCSKKRTPQTQQAEAPPSVHSVPRTDSQRAAAGHEAWKEAKARTAKLKTMRSPDVYDDIEGAHSQGLPGIENATSIKKRPAQDPLRNQKTTTAKVQVTPRKDEGSLGFFKQFHSPKKVVAPPVEAPQKVIANQYDTNEMLGDGPDAQVEGSKDEDSVPVNRGPPQGRTGASDTYNGRKISDTGRKKTFEDQIRDLEDAARKDVEQQGEHGTPTGLSLRKRTGPRLTEKMVSHRSRITKASSRPTSAKKRTPATEAKIQTSEQQPDEYPTTSNETHCNGDDDNHIRRALFANPPALRNVPKPAPAETKVNGDSVKQTAQKEPHYTFITQQLSLIQTVVLEKLTRKRPIALTNLDDEYAKVSQIVSQTVTAGESNSMLLIGARGSGKTALVDCILREQAVQHAEDFHVVRLNGFIHTDDKIALREIWRQLGREIEPEHGDDKAKNYADTLTTLLALLSHSSEMGEDQPDRVTKSVIFVLDEFELFANHPRQTLLYNLFDIAQSRKAPIAVLGLTTRIDVAESLEKRVKSRFSHRYVHLSLAKSLAAFQDVCKASISVIQRELSAAEHKQLAANGQRSGDATKAWNSVIEDLFVTTRFASNLRRIYYTTKSVPDFLTAAFMPLATLPTEAGMDSTSIVNHLENGLGSELVGPDSKLELLTSLSTLQLALLICAARLNAIHNTEVISFALAYEEYKVLASKAKLQASASGSLAQGAGARISDKDVARGAWDDLLECGLVMDDGRAGGRVDVGLEELGTCGVDLGQWGRWCKEI